MRQVLGHGEHGRRPLQYPCTKRADEWVQGRTVPYPYCAATTTELVCRHDAWDRACSSAACAAGSATSAPARRSTICKRPSTVPSWSWLGRFHDTLSLRHVAEMALTRGCTVTHETVRCGEERFAPCSPPGGKAAGQRQPHVACGRGVRQGGRAVVLPLSGLGGLPQANVAYRTCTI